MIKRHSSAGAIQFDRDTKQLLFGRLAQQQSRQLSTITSVQLITTTLRAVLEKEPASENEASRPGIGLLHLILTPRSLRHVRGSVDGRQLPTYKELVLRGRETHFLRAGANAMSRKR